MTMADEIDPMGNARQVSDFQISNNNNSITTNQNIPWKQRKRKRLSAVLDKLHNNNTITKRCLNELDEVISESNNNNNNNNNNKNHSNNNQGEPSKIPLIDLQQQQQNQHQQHVGNESVRSSVGDDDDDDDDDNGDDDRSDFENPLNEELTNVSITEYPSMVKREQVNSSSPLGNENVAFNGDIKQENRTSDYEYASNQRIEQNISPMERYFPQMSSPLFEYYLQTKYFPDILRMRNNLQVQNSDSKIAKLLPELQHQQQQQQIHHHHEQQQRHRMEQYSPSHNSQTMALDLQQKPMKRENEDDTKIQPPTKKQRQRQPKQHQYTEKLSPPPPQDVPLDLSMKTILENITKATAIHKQSRSPSTSSTSSSISTVLNQWQNQPHDLSTNLASILVNPAHLNNHSAYTVAAAAVHHNQIPHIATSTGNQTMGQVPIIKGDVASPTTKESVAFRYNLNVSPVVEEMPPGTDVAYVCPICGQMFSLHDRLAKHMASRHKSKSNSSEITKSYVCEVCDRSFARSDMLTRHMRLHTGIKPYTCKVCNQVFSRSDHLSTHQRTHTGEKPYKCPQCPYAACRRDMITRHMRTHARYEAQRAAAAAAVAASNGSTIIDTTNVNQFQRNSIGNNHNLSKVKIKIEDNNQQNVSPKTLSPAYPASTIIKAENLC